MEIAIVGLLIVIAGLFVYIVYTDQENRKERERLQLKLISRNIVEYKESISPPDKDTPEPKQDEYLPVEDVDIEKLAQAEDNI